MIKNRITVNLNICHGKPTITGTRIMVWQLLDLLEDGLTFDQIINNYYPDICKEDIQACIEYANRLVKNEEVHFVRENR